MRRGGARRELAFALGAGVSLLRALEAAGAPLDEARSLIAFRLAADADESSPCRNSAPSASHGRGSRRPAGSSRGKPMSRRRAPGGDDRA